MAKKICCVCNKNIGILSTKAALSDGYICGDCLKISGISGLSNANSYTCETVKQLLDSRVNMITSFKTTKSVGSLILIDDKNKWFKIGNDIFRYDNLLSFELLEDGQTITKGGLGRAVAGGLLFGGVGAIVGGVTGGKKTKGVCTSMKIRVTLKNAHIDVVYIPLITAETKTNGFLYKTMQSSAQSCISALEIIADQNNCEQKKESESDTVSAADEILKFKNLMEAGIITQEEFEAKKKQLLGI